MKLRPIYEQIISEIGDSSSKIFPYSTAQLPAWSKSDMTGSETSTISFKTDQDTDYEVYLQCDDGWMQVDFKIKGNDYNHISNKYELFSVMSTITDIVKRMIILNPTLNGIQFKPANKGGAAGTDDKNQREKLYKVFAEKTLSKINKPFKMYNDSGYVVIEFT